jgi:hypothetical protein
MSKAEQQQKLLEEKEKFLLWLRKMGSIHQADAPKMQYALDKIR